MPLPETLELAVREALQNVHEHPQHEYMPAQRKKLTEVFFELNTLTADLARRWHSVLTAKHVLYLYVEPNYPPLYYEQIKEFPPDEWAQVQARARFDIPEEAVRLAEQVLKGEADAKWACDMASETHHYIGYYRHYQPVAAFFAEIASNRALQQASVRGFNTFRFFSEQKADYSNLDLILDNHGDTAACAFIAKCSVVNDISSDEKAESDSEFSRWIKNPTLDPQKSVDFWQWWLTDALKEAWQYAAEQSS